MPTLKEILCSPANRSNVVRDAAQLVDSEVSAKGGLSGIAIKAGYAAVKAIKPGLIAEVVDSLLDTFSDKLEPFFAEWQGGGRTQAFDAFLGTRTPQVSNALLSVTDDKARSATNATLKKTYEKLRPYGEKNVAAAVPGLGRMINRYVK